MTLLTRMSSVLAREDVCSDGGLVLEAAKAFVSAGGVLLLSDLDDITAGELAALAAANKQEHVIRALHIGLACAGPAGFARVASEIDGGEAYYDLVARAGLESSHGQQPATG